LAFSDEKFEQTEEEYKHFMEELIGNSNLTKFKDEFQKTWKMLKSSYEQEKRTVKAAKKVIDMIFESSQQVKAAIRMANNEVDRIREMTVRKEEEDKKVDARKSEKIGKETRVNELN